MSTPHYKKLMDSLGRQITLSRAFVALLDKEQAALLTMGMENLMRLNKQKESGIRQITFLDEQIQQIAHDMVQDHAPDDIIKLRDILPLLNKEEAKKLADNRQILTGLRRQIDEKNYINYSFTKDTLKYLNDAIGLISDGVNTEPIYSARGPGKAINHSPMLISKEV